MCGVVYNDQVYYLVLRQAISNSLIDKCLTASNGIWHSLCVFFEMKLTAKREISSRDLAEIVNSAKLLMIGAYDGEGYVFWESSIG